MKLYNATMHYVEILVADQSYHGNEALTYESEVPLKQGSLAFVPLRKKQVLGVVVKTSTTKPPFPTKSISSAVDLPNMPSQLLLLLDWMRSYYPAPLGIITQQLLPRALPKREIKPLDKATVSIKSLPEMTKDQKSALSLNPRLHRRLMTRLKHRPNPEAA